MRRVAIVVVVGLAALILTACAVVSDDQGFKFGNPADFAQATHIAQMSDQAAAATAQAVALEATKQTASIEAAATRSAQAVKATATAQAIVAQGEQAQADIERAKADAEQNALPAATARLALTYFGWGVGALVLAVGLAFGVVAWVNKRATIIYPDKRGQFPVIVRRGPGWVTFHDPNRALGPATVVRVPSAVDALAGVAIATLRALKSGERPELPTAEPQATFALPGSEPAMLQVATQAQAAQVRIAEQSGRPKIMLTAGNPVVPGDNGRDQRSAVGRRMPAVTVINDPSLIQDFERKLLTGGSDDD
jgi:hypothetical protein